MLRTDKLRMDGERPLAESLGLGILAASDKNHRQLILAGARKQVVRLPGFLSAGQDVEQDRLGLVILADDPINPGQGQLRRPKPAIVGSELLGFSNGGRVFLHGLGEPTSVLRLFSGLVEALPK